MKPLVKHTSTIPLITYLNIQYLKLSLPVPPLEISASKIYIYPVSIVNASFQKYIDLIFIFNEE